MMASDRHLLLCVFALSPTAYVDESDTPEVVGPGVESELENELANDGKLVAGEGPKDGASAESVTEPGATAATGEDGPAGPSVTLQGSELQAESSTDADTPSGASTNTESAESGPAGSACSATTEPAATAEPTVGAPSAAADADATGKAVPSSSETESDAESTAASSQESTAAGPAADPSLPWIKRFPLVCIRHRPSICFDLPLVWSNACPPPSPISTTAVCA